MSLYGLVVCGGRSTRMGTDKSMLNYHGQPQRYHLYEMLTRLCEKVFISCNAEQATTIPGSFSVLVDEPEYADIGPMAALLTAFKHYPDSSFLVIGCDYPFVQIDDLWKLTEVSLQSNNCVAYYNSQTNYYEPLISVYQSFILNKLNENFQLKNYSLQSVLKEINADIIVPDDYMRIKSIDNMEAYNIVMEQLHSNTKSNR